MFVFLFAFVKKNVAASIFKSNMPGIIWQEKFTAGANLRKINSLLFAKTYDMICA